MVLYKTGVLPCGSPPTLIPPLCVVCLESPPSQGLPNFGQVTRLEIAMQHPRALSMQAAESERKDLQPTPTKSSGLCTALAPPTRLKSVRMRMKWGHVLWSGHTEELH